jgi:hypothetical protein
MLGLGKKRGIALHDGERWHAVVYRYSGGDWREQGRAQFEAPNAKHLPDDMLAWLSERGARRLRVILHADVHTVRMELPKDTHPEEVQTAIAYEAAAEIGVDAHLLRVSAVCSDRYRLGGRHDLLLVVGHEQAVLERYSQDCARHRLRFEGAGCLELVALARHARESTGERLLILRQHAGFLAVPASEATDLFLRAVAFGSVPLEDQVRESELLAQSTRSFGLLSHTPIHVVASHGLEPERIERLRSALGDNTELRVETLEGFVPRMLKHVAWSHPGSTDQGCALVGPAPKPPNPGRAGTWAAAVIVVATALCLGWLWKTATDDLAAVQQRRAAWDELTAARKAADGTYKGLLRERDELMELESVLTKSQRLNPGLPALLDVLGASMPPYTRVSAINQVGDRIEVNGKARWPRGATLLAEAMGKAMRPHGYQVEPGSLATDDADGERAFSYRLIPTGRP